jgi:hypothetical protein
VPCDGPGHCHFPCDGHHHCGGVPRHLPCDAFDLCDVCDGCDAWKRWRERRRRRHDTRDLDAAAERIRRQSARRTAPDPATRATESSPAAED